jgi:hypothetical protein
MKRWVHRRYRYQKVQARSWLRKNPRFRDWLQRRGALSIRNGGLRRGAAVGLFIGMTPTVGIQTIFMLMGCMAWRGSFPVAFAVSWVSNPVTMGPLYLGWHYIGELLFEPLLLSVYSIDTPAEQALLETVLTVLGSLPLAAVTALIGYWLGRDAERLIERKREARQRALQEEAASGESTASE